MTAARSIAWAWSLLAALLLGYVALMTWGPSTASPAGLITQVIAQKVATVVVVGMLAYIARAERENVIRGGLRLTQIDAS